MEKLFDTIAQILMIGIIFLGICTLLFAMWFFIKALFLESGDTNQKYQEASQKALCVHINTDSGMIAKCISIDKDNQGAYEYKDGKFIKLDAK